MIKKFLTPLMSVVFLSMLVTAANAGLPSAGGIVWGWGNSVDCTSLWKSIGNTEREPIDIQCAILPVQVEASCANPAGNTGGGVVFDLEGDEISADTLVINPEENIIEGPKGRYDAEVHLDIHDDVILDTINADGLVDQMCDAFNNGSSDWTGATPVYVIKMFAAVRAWKDLDGDGDFTDLVEDVQSACKAPDGEDFSSPGNYLCDELCDKTKSVDCPESLSTYLNEDCVNEDGSTADAPGCYFDFQQ